MRWACIKLMGTTFCHCWELLLALVRLIAEWLAESAVEAVDQPPLGLEEELPECKAPAGSPR